MAAMAMIAMQMVQPEIKRIQALGFATTFLRHLGPDMLPQVAEHRHFGARDVVCHRHAGQLDDAALNGVHQRKIAHRPGEHRPLCVAGAAQEERGGGEVVDRAHAAGALALPKLTVERLDPGSSVQRPPPATAGGCALPRALRALMCGKAKVCAEGVRRRE